MEKEDTDIELFHTNGIELPFETNSIDTSVVVTVLMHNKNRELVKKIVAEICRVTKAQICIFEETSRKLREKFAHEKRSVEFYESVFHENGFDMSSLGYLDVELSRICCGALDRVFFGSKRGQGTPISRSSRNVQAMLIPATKHIDNIIKKKQGLTQMFFLNRQFFFGPVY